jgi:DNA (cytosine-5)-methyltransferase 1
MELTHGSLFTGIGGFDLAFQSVGIPTSWMVEIEPYSQAVLRKNFPGVPLHGDIRGVGAKNLAGVDIITGGFPCGPFSQAGKKKGAGDARYLWPQMLRVVSEVGPRWVVAENVRGFLSLDGGRHFEKACSDLENLGYEIVPLVLSACAFGAPHKRQRVWIVAHASGIRLRARDEGQDGRKDGNHAAGIRKASAHANGVAMGAQRRSEVQNDTAGIREDVSHANGQRVLGWETDARTGWIERYWRRMVGS